MKKKRTWIDWAFAVIALLLVAIAAVGFVVLVEYGRYLLLAPDGMDFSTFYWLDTLRR